MKLRKFLSGLMFGLGCALSFIGLMAVVLPKIKNTQLQLVLSGFEMTSDHLAVNAVNRFMQFVFAQNWRVLYLGLLIAALGALLLLRFSPKPVKPYEPPQQPVPEIPVQPEGDERPNPFARAAYHQPSVEESVKWSYHSEPILERNEIEETPAEPAAEVQPYFSPRFSVESRAMETETGAWSQSGSRILIRSVPAPEPEPETEPAPIPHAPAPVIPSPELTAPPPVHAPSPRIRSTMGQHRRIQRH